jgi:hypothetical protein
MSQNQSPGVNNNSIVSFKPGLNVAHETFEGEIVVVNLETGRYYAMQGEAADIFTLCVQVATCDEIVDALGGNYQIEDPETTAQIVLNFLERLKDEGVIVETGNRPESAHAPMLESAPQIKFSIPQFDIHNDMQDLLMLDPIHEVDEAGWPHFKPDSI